MGLTVPTLSASGWERGIKEKADRLMSYFIVSQYSQSEIYYGQIKSLPYLIKTYSSNDSDLSSQISSAINGMFKGYFDSVDSNVTIETDPLAENKKIIKISTIVTEKGVKYSLGRLLEVSNSIVSKVTNQGDE